MLGIIWDWGKKAVITGAVVSSAPFFIPPLFLISTLGFIVFVPFCFAFMGYACTAKAFKFLSIRIHLFLVGEDDGQMRSMTKRFEAGNDKKGQLEGLTEETEETEKKDGERSIKQSETDDGWKEEEMETVTKREDRMKEQDIECLNEIVFQSTKWGDERTKEADQVADNSVIEGRRGELFEGPKESRAVEDKEEEDKEPTKTEEKNINHEVEINLHISEETLYGHHPSTYKSEPATSPGTAGYFAPPTLSFDYLINATKAPESSEYSSLVVEASLERNGMNTDCVDEGVFEGKIWEEIESLRMIIGCRTALQASFVEELKALYVFTGIEPPSAFSLDLCDANHKLRYLKSVVGIRKP